MAEREKAEDVFSNLLDEKQHLVRYITTNKQKMRKLEKTFFQDTEKQDKTRKINVKHVQQTKETDKIAFFW